MGTREKTEKTVTAGVDEAGRGAVIGPLVVAGVSADRETLKKMEKMGLRDSKELSPKRREKLAKEIEKVARDVVIIKVDPCRIDSYRNSGINLNRIEGMKFVDVLNLLQPHLAYIDAPENNLNRFKGYLRKETGRSIDLVVEHKADKNYKIVSAASIIAKVERDREIEKLKKQYGDFGPGYTSNQITMQWMRDWLEKNKGFPDIVRKTWVTAQTVRGEKEQSLLSKFFGVFRKEEECGE
jgi:ribonuclease HII